MIIFSFATTFVLAQTGGVTTLHDAMTAHTDRMPCQLEAVLVLLVGRIFQDVAWLTVEGLADGLEGRETDGLGLARL